MAALSQGGSHFQAMGKLQFCILHSYLLSGFHYFHRSIFHEGIIIKQEKIVNVLIKELRTKLVADNCNPKAFHQRNQLLNLLLEISFCIFIPSYTFKSDGVNWFLYANVFKVSDCFWQHKQKDAEAGNLPSTIMDHILPSIHMQSFPMKSKGVLQNN